MCHSGVIVIHQSTSRSLVLINFKDLDEMLLPLSKQSLFFVNKDERGLLVTEMLPKRMQKCFSLSLTDLAAGVKGMSHRYKSIGTMPPLGL